MKKRFLFAASLALCFHAIAMEAADKREKQIVVNFNGLTATWEPAKDPVPPNGPKGSWVFGPVTGSNFAYNLQMVQKIIEARYPDKK